MPNQKFESFRPNYLSLNKRAELVFSGVLSDEAGWEGKRHEHIGACEVILVVRGSGSTNCGGKRYEFVPGDLIIYNERVMHSERVLSSSGPTILYYVVIKNFALENMEDSRLLPDDVSPVLPCGDELPVLRQLYEFILSECADQDPGYETVVNSLLQALLIKVIRVVNDQYQLLRCGTQLSLGARIQEYIDANYMKDLTLKDIARQFYISHYYLEHVFKQYSGDSPINYLICRRLEVARKLLETTDLPIKTIAAMTGYESSPYFCVAFKKAAGLPASEYRAARRASGAEPRPEHWTVTPADEEQAE